MAEADSVPVVATEPVEASGIGRLAARLAHFAAPRASDWDRQGRLPDEVRLDLGRTGLLGADVPVGHGGLGGSQDAPGELCARIGGVCSALRGLVTVQSMVTAALLRWGTGAQRARWLPGLAGDVSSPASPRPRPARAPTWHGSRPGTRTRDVEETVR